MTTSRTAGTPQPVRSPPAAAQAECGCSKLEALQIEMRNALRLQQAFRNKIPELRAMEMEGRQSSAELKRWTEKDARRGLEQVPGSSGPAEVDYKPWGDKLSYQDDERVTAKFTNDELCRRSDESAAALEEAKKKSGCAGIAEAIQVHEDWHLNFCRTIGYRPYWLGMHGADRAQEEVEAYDKQTAVLRAEIARVVDLKDCKQSCKALFYVLISTRPSPASSNAKYYTYKSYNCATHALLGTTEQTSPLRKLEFCSARPECPPAP